MPNLEGRVFRDPGQPMRVVRKHEKLEKEWWCEGVYANAGLWAYHEDYIIRNLIKA